MLRESWKRKAWIFLIVPFLLLGVASVEAQSEPGEDDRAPGRRLAQQATKAPGGKWTTADHSKFKPLQQKFDRPEQVTQACLSCHVLAADQIHHTIHWTWICPDCGDGTNMGKYGKTINNFCVAVPSNEPRCTSCHIGYGWKNKDFDFKSKEKIDCVVCHDTTHTYTKFPAGAGYPVTKETVFKSNKKTYYPPDWNKVAQNVGRPDRINCGTCHFYGGGGDGVKHGDLDSSLKTPKKSLDVHMDVDGLNFTCQRCHTTKDHQIAGRLYTIPAAPERISLTEADLASKIACESCHSAAPHKTENKANDHTDKVACQSCHIPSFARVKPTKLWWDWSKAGKKKDGKPYSVMGPLGKPEYVSKKGEFIWGKNVVPEYRWFNGAMSHNLVTDKIDPTEIVALNQPVGSPDDPKSRIMPFKVHRGKQPYDAKLNQMVMPHLFGKKGSGAYWADWDWTKSVASAMKYVDLPFSGEVGFVETEFYYPTTHMVAPREQSVNCIECHSTNSRLANITGVYIPGRDKSTTLDMLGWGAVVASFIAVFIHGIMRIVSRKRRG